MTVDKMYISYQMTESEFTDARDKLNAFFKGTRDVLRWDKDNKSYVTNGTSNYGLQEIRLRKIWKYFGIEIRLRPEILGELDGSNYYGLTLINDFEEIAMRFDYIMKDILGLNVPEFFKWMTKRIEFAIDLFLGEELLSKFLCLIKKGNIPVYMLEDRREVTKKYLDSETNAYLNASTVTVQWYNRFKTLQEKEKKSKKKFRDYECTKGILRFEIQCKDCNKKVRDMLSVDLFKNRIWYFYNLIVGGGDYHTLENAKEIIKTSVKNGEKKAALLRFVEFINKCGSVWEAKKQFSEQLEFSSGKKTHNQIMDIFSSRLCKLRKLGVNPICLPSEWGIEKLENLDRRIIEYIEQTISEV